MNVLLTNKKDKKKLAPIKLNILPTGTRGRSWKGEISYIPKDVLDHQSPLQKFDQIHAKYLTSPRDYDLNPVSYKQKAAGKPIKNDSALATARQLAKIEKGVKRDKESFRTRMVNIVM